MYFILWVPGKGKRRFEAILTEGVGIWRHLAVDGAPLSVPRRTACSEAPRPLGGGGASRFSPEELEELGREEELRLTDRMQRGREQGTEMPPVSCSSGGPDLQRPHQPGPSEPTDPAADPRALQTHDREKEMSVESPEISVFAL